MPIQSQSKADTINRASLPKGFDYSQIRLVFVQMCIHESLLCWSEWLAEQLVFDLLLWQAENGLNEAFDSCIVSLAGIGTDHVLHGGKEIEASFDLALLSEYLHAVRDKALDAPFFVRILHSFSAICNEKCSTKLLLGNELFKQS